MTQPQTLPPRTALAGAALLLCALLACYKLELGPVAAVLAAAAALYGYRRAGREGAPRRAWLCCGGYAALLSLAVVAGRDVRYAGMEGGADVNFIDWGADSLLASLALAALICPAVLALYRFTLRRQLTPAQARPSRLSVWLAMWALIFVCWTPYLLTFYPAGIVGDGALTLEEALAPGVPSSNHWVVPVILTMRFFLWLGSLISADLHVGVFLYALAQSLLFSAVCAAVAYRLWRAGAPRWAAWGSAAMYAVSGFFASYGMALWKDALFAAGVVWLALQLWQLPRAEPGWKQCLNFTLTALFLCFWRNNGLYVLLLCLAALAVLMRRRAKRLLACGLAAAVFALAVTGPVYDALGIRKDSLTESVSVPMQQIAAALSAGAETTPEQEAVLFRILPEEEWTASYHPTLSDDLKGNAALDAAYLETHFGDFLAVWAQLLPANFGTYVEAYLMQTLGCWQPGVFQGSYTDYWIGVQDVAGRGWHSTDWIETLTGRSLSQLLQRSTRFVPSGTMVWVMFLAFALVLAQGQGRRASLLVLAPFAASWLVLMLAMPIAYAYRYILMLAVGLPLLCLLPFAGQTAAPSAGLHTPPDR
ncbi:MAG TPA: hypothetical protein H9915_10480 [Candidatus Gemmiger faecigallinarum]|nr:hypothetical protein [Candidatus Gemmiger faecigallinarum]